jgi:hypothetical protein
MTSCALSQSRTDFSRSSLAKKQQLELNFRADDEHLVFLMSAQTSLFYHFFCSSEKLGTIFCNSSSSSHKQTAFVNSFIAEFQSLFPVIQNFNALERLLWT